MSTGVADCGAHVTVGREGRCLGSARSNLASQRGPKRALRARVRLREHGRVRAQQTSRGLVVIGAAAVLGGWNLHRQGSQGRRASAAWRSSAALHAQLWSAQARQSLGRCHRATREASKATEASHDGGFVTSWRRARKAGCQRLRPVFEVDAWGKLAGREKFWVGGWRW